MTFRLRFVAHIHPKTLSKLVQSVYLHLIWFSRCLEGQVFQKNSFIEREAHSFICLSFYFYNTMMFLQPSELVHLMSLTILPTVSINLTRFKLHSVHRSDQASSPIAALHAARFITKIPLVWCLQDSPVVAAA